MGLSHDTHGPANSTNPRCPRFDASGLVYRGDGYPESSLQVAQDSVVVVRHNSNPTVATKPNRLRLAGFII